MNDLRDFSKIIADLSPYIIGMGLFIGLFIYKWMDSLHRSLLIYLGILLFTDLLAEFLPHFIKNNLIVLHIYSFAELAFMFFLYKKYIFRKRQLILTVLGIVGLTYIVAEMLLIFVFKGLVVKQFQPYAKVVDNFIIILMALAYLYEKMSRYRESLWGNFRLNIVFLVFFTLNTLFFLPFNFMVNATGNVKFYFWTGHIILLILFYLYLIFEIVMNGFRGTRSHIAT